MGPSCVPGHAQASLISQESAPKTATKRIFLITDEDDPHSGPGSMQLITSARTTLDVSPLVLFRVYGFVPSLINDPGPHSSWSFN
jgi:hypothetical protein